MKAKKILSVIIAIAMIIGTMSFTVFADEPTYVAKVGNTEYATIDEAIANWTNGTTLTLLANVTLSDVIKLSSTEYHILDLGTYTMTAASGKDAIQYVINGRSSAGYALDIKADATNPGGITATGSSIVRHNKPLTGAPSKDRPITRFYGGVFNASYVVRQGGTFGAGYTGASAPYFYFYGGEYNGTIYTNRSQNQFYGGTFNGSMQMSVDSSAYTLIAGGTFKQLSNSMGSELNSDKFTIGSAKGVYDKEVYVDDNGNYVIAAAKPAEGVEASVAKTPGTNDYLAYSKVGTEGQLNYTDVYTALNNNTSATVTVNTDELDLTDSKFTGTIVVPEGQEITIIVEENTTPAWSVDEDAAVTYTDAEGNVLEKSEDGVFVAPAPAYVAKVGDTPYESVAAALADAQAKDMTDVTITLCGETTSATEDTFDLSYGTAFENVTFKQEDASKPYYISGIYTGDRTNSEGKFIFDGVNIISTSNIWFECDVVLKNNSVLTRTDDSKNFVYYGTLTIEPGSKFISQIDDVMAGSLTVDGGKSDGSYNNTPDYHSIFFTVGEGQTFTVKNGAYALFNAANEIGTITLNGNAYVSDSKVDVFNYIDIGSNGLLKVDCDSVVTAQTVKGTGTIIIDAADLPVGEEVTVIEQTSSSAISLENMVTIENNDNVTVNYDGGDVKLLKKYVAAKIGNTEYATLQAALDAAKAGDIVTVISDITLEKTVTIKNGMNITLDLNGKTIDFDPEVWVYGADKSGTALFTVAFGGTLTIEDSSEEETGTIDGSKDVNDVYGAVMMTAKGDDAANGTAKLIVNSGTLIGGYAAIAGNKDRDDTEIVINGGTIEAGISDEYSTCAIEHPMNGKLTINGGTIEGMDGISLRSGILVIKGGTIIGNAPTTAFEEDGSWDNDFGTCTGHAVQIVNRQNSNSANETPVVSITGGTFISENADAVGSYAGYRGETPDTQIVGFISGGTFSSDVSEYVATGNTIVKNGDGTISVQEKAWTTATDAGCYGEDNLGMMRFLFAFDIEETNIEESGIKYVKSANITDFVYTTEDVAGNKAAFFGDIVGIPNGQTGTYYAVAYMETKDGNVFWSAPLGCNPNFEKVFTGYTPKTAGVAQ